jgi:predicted lipoprotein
LIERAVQQSPSDVEALEAIGAPAKGLPALEWLLWAAPKKQAVCAYAHVLALEVLDEAQALQAGFAKDTAAESNEAATAQAAEAFLNQWVGGVEMLRWRYLGKPLESASARKSPEFVHALSGHTVQTWTAQWASLRDFARWPNDKDKGARPPGADIEHPTEALIPLSLYLQGRGLLDLAHRLDVALAKADAAVAKLQPAQPKTLRAAISSLGALRQLVETDVAAAMQVNMGFSDADGD